MVEFNLPVVPTGVITVLGLLSPYVQALLNDFKWTSRQKKWATVLGSIAMSVIAIALYYGMTGDTSVIHIELVFIFLAAGQLSYGLLTKDQVKMIERNYGVGTRED